MSKSAHQVRHRQLGSSPGSLRMIPYDVGLFSDLRVTPNELLSSNLQLRPMERNLERGLKMLHFSPGNSAESFQSVHAVSMADSRTVTSPEQSAVDLYNISAASNCIKRPTSSASSSGLVVFALLSC